MKGHTISGNEIELRGARDYEQIGYRKMWYWSEVYITMNGHEMNIEDLSERNKELIMDQMPPL